MPGTNQREALQDRFKKFALDVLKTVKTLPINEENRIYSRQLIRSSSSIGANYAEAVYAQTKQEFLHCLNISRREANETLYWLEILYSTNESFKHGLDTVIDENKQILRILISSVKTTRDSIKNGQ